MLTYPPMCSLMLWSVTLPDFMSHDFHHVTDEPSNDRGRDMNFHAYQSFVSRQQTSVTGSSAHAHCSGIYLPDCMFLFQQVN